MNFDQARKRAESSFKKDARAREGAKAMSEYEANIRAVREKTARLRALRLVEDGQAVAKQEALACELPCLPAGKRDADVL